MLASLEARPTDPLLSLISLLEADPRADKIDLGVGVYRDATGCTPVMAAIKAAETLLVELQDSKSYLGPEGDTGFVDAMAHLAFATVAAGKSYAGLQTPGGTGALRLLLELWLRANPDGTVWLGIPSWPVHETMIRRVGARLQTYIHYDTIAQRPCPDALLAAIHAAKAGDLFLLHGCCHNPSGADPDKAMWQTIGEALSSVGAIALVDLAYQGLGDGLDEDAAGLHILLDHVPELLLAYSCDKNFGLYRDRVGAAYVLCDNAAHLEIAERIRTIRNRLAQYGNIGKFELGRLRYEKGMFALLPTTPDQVVQLRNEFSVFMVGSGRVNLAGLKETDCDRLVQAISRLD